MGQSVMIPEYKLSSSSVYAPFIGGRAGSIKKDVDFESGGIAISDPSQGLNYQTWKAYLHDYNVILSSSTQQEFIAYTGDGITEISFTFDRNMNFTLAFVQNCEAKLYWYDSSIPGMTVTNFGTSYSNPRVTLDDKRDISSNSSDIIFAYVKNSGLYYRMQRDRYEVEYELIKSGIKKLKKIGMNNKLRLQFLIE